MPHYTKFIDGVIRGNLLTVRGNYREGFIERNWWGRQSIHWACCKGHVDVVEWLLSNGAEIDARDYKDGWRPIHFACANGHADVVQMLVDRGCQVDVLSDKDGSRPIHLASTLKNSNVLQILLGQDCDIDARTQEGETALDLARKNENEECVRLIEKAKENMRSNAFIAARQDDLNTFQKHPFHLCTKDPETGQTLLDVIMQANSKSIIESITRAPFTDKDIADFLSLDKNDFSDQSYRLLQQWVVHCCIRHNIDWAFLRLCNADVVNSGTLLDGKTCLDTAVETRRSLCVRHVLHKYVAPDDSWDRAGSVAVDKGYDEVIELMLHRQMILQKNLSIGRNRLHIAVNEGDLDMVEYLQQKGIADNSDTNQEGDTALMMAVANGMDECVQAIKQHSSTVDVINKHGQTVLHSAVVGRMDALLDWMIAEPCQVEQRDCMGLTALQQAVVANLEGVAAQLVAVGANHRSVIQANLASMRLQNAIFKGFPISPSEHLQLTSQENSSSLCLKLHGRIYPCFLDDFTTHDVNFVDRNGNSLLHLAAMLTDADGCRRMIENGAAIGAVNECRNTPLVELLVHLHQHHRRGSCIDAKALATVTYLIDGGADISDEHANGKTALEIAIELLDERLLLELVRRNPPVKQLTLDEFNKCVENRMFQFLENIVPKLSEKMAQEYVTGDTIRRCALEGQHSAAKICFIYSNPDVREEVIEQVLYEAACRDDVEYFEDILRMHRTNWKQMPNGESILTILIREKRWGFCEVLVETGTASKLLELTDPNGNSALMVAIEADAKELIERLIVERVALDSENSSGDTALSMLLEKVSSATGDRRGQLKMWIKNLIMSVDIYQVNRHNKAAINFCSSTELRKEFETFYNRQPKQQWQQSQEGSSSQSTTEINVCGVCLDRQVNRVLDCGHTLCKECADKMFECPFCRAPDTNPRRLVLP